MDQSRLVPHPSCQYDSVGVMKYVLIALVAILSLIALFIAYWVWDGYLYEKDLKADFDREVKHDRTRRLHNSQ